MKVEQIAIFTIGTHTVVTIDAEPLDPSEKETLARRDGFESFADMLRFWDGRLPFRGNIIHWNYAARQIGAKQ